MMSIIMVDTATFYAMDFMEMMIIIVQYFAWMGTEAWGCAQTYQKPGEDNQGLKSYNTPNNLITY